MSASPPPEPLRPHDRYAVQLLCESPHAIPADAALTEAFRRQLPEAAPQNGERLAFTLGTADAIVRLRFRSGVEHAAEVEAALAQTWDWEQAGDAVSQARSSVQVELTIPETIVASERLRLVHLCLLAVAELRPPVALHWRPSQRLVEPAAWRASLAHGAPPVDHALNVRLFRVPDGLPGEGLMDTMGLAPLGLPDLQCRFHGLELEQMAQLLFAYGGYLVERGDVLGDDSLVRGLASHEEWECRRGESLAPPLRAAVTLLPDEAHRVP